MLANATYIPVAEFKGGALGPVGNRIPYTPKLTTNVGINYSKNGFKSFLNAYHVSSQYADSANTVVESNDGTKGLIPSFTTLNWSSVKRIDTKYSLTLETDRGVVRAWAAPAPSRYAGFLANKSEAEHLPESSFIGKGLVRPGDLTSSDSGVAAYVIRSHWEQLRDKNQLGDEPVVVSRWSATRIAVFLLLSSAAVFGFIS
jgi:hypothetical protein